MSSGTSGLGDPLGLGAAGARVVEHLELRFPIATKLVMSYGIIIVLTSAIFSVVGVRIIGNRFVAQAQETVRTDLNSAREIYLNYVTRIDDKVRFVADRTFVRDPRLGGTRAQLTRTLEEIRRKDRLDVLAITDTAGVVVLRTTNPGIVGDNQSHDQLVRAVLRKREPAASTAVVPAADLRRESVLLAKRAFFELIPTPMARPRDKRQETSGMMLKAAAPVFDMSNRFVGVVYGGVLLNRDYEIVDKIKRTLFMGLRYEGRDIGTATIFQDDMRISTNVLNVDGSRATGTRMAENVYNQVIGQGQQWIGRAYVVNNWNITAYEPIFDYRGGIIGSLYVGMLEAKYVEVRTRTIFAFLAVTLIGALVVMGLSYLVSRKISASVRTLVFGVERMTRGDLDHRVELQSGDEFQELAETFNDMAAALKKRDEKLKELTARKLMESERLAIVGQLAAGVAHEINNPLQGIVAYSHLLLERLPEGDPGRVSVGKIVTQADRCREIVRGLLDFSRQRKPDKRPHDVNAVLQECVSLVDSQAMFHNIEIVKNLDPSLPRVPMDRAQVQQIFMNIILNAAEAMTEGGRLRLATRLTPDRSHVEVQFADTGCGISEENLERIFDPFFTTREARHGTGLGLAISYGIVKEHQGTISVESTVGKGTTFFVRLPVTTEGVG